jgi:hypothetical protein
VLMAKFGSSRLVIDDIVSQMEKMKTITTDKGFVEFVEKLEKIKLDLETLKIIGEIANSTVIGKLESKLPTLINIDWSKIVTEEEMDTKTSKEKFERFMTFLKLSKQRIEYLTADARQCSGGGIARSVTQVNFVTGVTTLVVKKSETNVGGRQNDRSWKACLACDVDGATDLRATQHPMESCEVWNSLTVKEREKKVKCLKHPFKSDHTTQTCTISGRKCKFCSQDSHHFLLCPKKPVVKSASRAATMSVQSDQVMLPVMVQAQFVTAPDNSSIGSLMDLCSTDDYVTHKYAKKKNLPGEDVELVVEGMGGKETYYKTKLCMVPIMVQKERYDIPCYGMDKISSVASPPESTSYKKLCSKFGVMSGQLRRPRSIDLLISMRQNFLHPKASKTIGGITLFNGVLGKVFGGSDPDLVFEPYVMSYPLSVHQTSVSETCCAKTMRAVVKEATYTTTAKTEKEFLEFFHEENIGVECKPRCGGCKCGKCPTGAKQMSIKDERDYEKFKSLMHLDETGTEEDPGPYWVSTLPWTVEKSDLVNNKSAVLGVMNSTMRKLAREPSWKEIYEKQLNDLIEKQFAREVSDKELDAWIKSGGEIYYISHQMALNPASKSTPVRVVFNSSQKFRGYSLNSSWELGPDVLNSLH